MENTEIDKKLRELLETIDTYDGFVEGVFHHCETQEERKGLIDYIEYAHPTSGQICEYAAVTAIRAGRAEGELEKCDESYWL